MKRLGQVNVGVSVDRLRAASSTRIAVPAPAFVRARLAAGITVETADLPPALPATLKHAASMPNPLFYEWQRRRAKTRGVIDIAALQTLARTGDITALTSDYGLVVVDECHHVPAAAFEHAVRQIPARRWLGLTATPYRRDQLDDLIALQLGPVRHTMTQAPSGTLSPRPQAASPPAPVLRVHPTASRYTGDADPSAPGGIAAIYRDLAADQACNRQITTDVLANTATTP